MDVVPFNALSVYDPDDPKKTADGFDGLLCGYLREYDKTGLRPACYPDVDTFIDAYLR